MQNAKSKMQNEKCKMQNAKFIIQNAKYEIQNAKCKMQILKAISGSNANALFVQWELTKNSCKFYNLLSEFCGGFQANSLDLVPTGRVVKCQKVYTDKIF